MKMKRRKLCMIVLSFCTLWFCMLIYFYSELDVRSFLGRPILDQRVHELMTSAEYSVPYNPVLNILMQPEGLLHFYHLPKRKPATSFTEVTSANRDASYPLAPDFAFHLSYSRDKVVLYEDRGMGCVYRIYLFPVLPTNANDLHRIKSKDLAGLFLHVDVDNKAFKFSLQQVMEGAEFPFISPLSTKHPSAASGLGSYSPMCYQDYMIVSYVHKGAFPRHLFNITVQCTMKDEMCPVHTYSAVSRHKFNLFSHDQNPPISSFARSYHNENSYAQNLKTLAYLLQQPQNSGPDYGKACNMQCLEVCKNCERTALRLNSPGVVSSMKIRVFETAHSRVLTNWNRVRLVITFDSAALPQINVPLGTLFGASSSLNDFRGAAIGRRRKYCTYKDSLLVLPKEVMTGYFYLPMPFWRNIDITIQGESFITTSITVCFDLTIEQNFYPKSSTGYLHAMKSSYGDDVSGFRDILHLNSTWGHIVGLFVEVDNLNPIHGAGVLHRWPALEADVMLFVDGRRSAAMMGTGLEDYFSYAHGFMMSENTSYSFVGNHHSSPRRKQPLTWHCYRQHIFDPIPFQQSVHFYMEGTSRENHSLPTSPLLEGVERRKNKEETVLSHMVLYYAQKSPRLKLLKTFLMDTEDVTINGGIEFSVHKRRYVGASNNNMTYTCVGKSFQHGDTIEIAINPVWSPSPLILRRDFYSEPGRWNESADVYINDKLLGRWFIPMGSTCEEYSLQQDDFNLGHNLPSTQFTILIEPLTAWNDCKYELYSLL